LRIQTDVKTNEDGEATTIGLQHISGMDHRAHLYIIIPAYSWSFTIRTYFAQHGGVTTGSTPRVRGDDIERQSIYT